MKNKFFAIAFALFVLGFVATPRRALADAPSSSDMLFSSGTSAALLAVGTGTLFNIHITSGAAADFAVCYDTASATGLTATPAGNNTLVELMRVFVSTGGFSTGVPGSASLPAGIPPVIFTNGLGCIQSAVNRTNIYYRQPN